MAAPASTAMPIISKPRPYRRYLTSALHTRFVHAVLLALLNSLFVAFWTGKDYFWSWFPLGPAGLKAALFTMSSLFVFVLQLATMHVGRRTSASTAALIRSTLFSPSTYQIIFWYVVSAWWFCEAYIWAVPDSHNMGWVIRGWSKDPDKLNERPIYLRFFFTVIAIVQSGLHVYYGQSFLHIPVSDSTPPQTAVQETHIIESIQKQLRNKLPVIVVRALLASAVATVTAPFVYKAFFRDLFWKIHLSFAKPFFNLSKADADPPATYFIGSILASVFLVGIGLSFSWQMATHSFLMYLKQAPLKNGLPLSAGSKDPNGTLLNGLAAKRSIVKTFAFWELSLIAQKFPDRRKAIFADFERSNGPVWSSMSEVVLSVIADIDTRILALNPSPPEPAQSQEPQQIHVLPRITKGISNQPALASLAPPSTKTQRVESFLAVTNKALGESKNPWSPPIKQTQQKLLEYTSPAAVSGGHDLPERMSNALRNSPVRALIRSNLSQKISSVILGAPSGNTAIIVDATEALTQMLVASLNEDDFGKAVQTVPRVVKQFCRTIRLIEGYVGANVKALGTEDHKQLAEVIIVTNRLKAGLRELLAAFQVFLNDAGLGIKDLNEARRAAEARPLMPVQTAPAPPKTRPELEQTGRPKRPSHDSRGDDRNEDNTREVRARETAQSLRRIETQPRRQRISNTENNVFGARDFNTARHRSREVDLVR